MSKSTERFAWGGSDMNQAPHETRRHLGELQIVGTVYRTEPWRLVKVNGHSITTLVDQIIPDDFKGRVCVTVIAHEIRAENTGAE